MRINKYVAQATGMSRRRADTIITEGRVHINRQLAAAGSNVEEADLVTLDAKPLHIAVRYTTIMLNKPVGYVVSRQGQGSQTIYELLPPEFHNLKPVGRLDKDSSGLLLLTDDGDLANQLTHPSYEKAKVYLIELDTPLAPLHRQMITDIGISLPDGLSKFQLDRPLEGDDYHWQVVMRQGRNRQIRRTFQSLGYRVVTLHRTQFGNYRLSQLGATRRFMRIDNLS